MSFSFQVLGRDSAARAGVFTTPHGDVAEVGSAGLLVRALVAVVSPGAPVRRWDGKTCLVTGASGALGLALCHHLAAGGARRIFCVARRMDDVAALRRFVAERHLDCDVVPISLDVAEPETVRALTDRIASTGAGELHAVVTKVKAATLSAGGRVIQVSNTDLAAMAA